MDTTFRGLSAPWQLGFVWSSLVCFLIFALPLDFHCRVRVVRFSPWQALVPCLAFLMGLLGVTLFFCVVWFGFRLFRRYLAWWPSQIGRAHRLLEMAWWPSQIGRAHRLLEMVGEGCPGHGLIHLLSASVAEIGFSVGSFGFGLVSAWFALACSNLAGPMHFKAAILDAWRTKVAAGLCGREGSRGGPLLDVHGFLQLLDSSYVRERDKGLLRSIMVGGVWNGYLLGKVRVQPVPCRFYGAPDNDSHLFWECTIPLLVEIS